MRRARGGGLLGRALVTAGLVSLSFTSGAGAQVAVRGETVYTMAGAPIKNGMVLVGRAGTIERVGPAGSVSIPKGYRVLTTKVVTPGLIDAHTVVGLGSRTPPTASRTKAGRRSRPSHIPSRREDVGAARRDESRAGSAQGRPSQRAEDAGPSAQPVGRA